MICLYDQNIWGNMGPRGVVANRNRVIRGLIEDVQPDFVAFQECNPITSRVGDEPMQDLMAPVYAEVREEDAMRNFTPVFYKKELWTLLDSGFMPYAGLNDALSKSLTWGVFERRTDGRRVGVVSTHFWYKAAAPEDFAQRLTNADDLRAQCERIASRYQIPILVTGDFNNGANTTHGDEPYRKMCAEGFTDVRCIAAQTTDCHTIHNLPHRSESGLYDSGDLPFKTIDYIFTYAQPVRAQRFEVLTSPEALLSSDHCPLVAHFDL